MGRRAINPGESGEVTVKRVQEGRRVEYRARVRWRDEDGGYHEHRCASPSRAEAVTTVTGARDAAVQAHKASKATEAHRGTVGVTLDQAAERWLASLNRRPSTVAQYRATWRSALSPVIGSLGIDEVDRATLYRAATGADRAKGPFRGHQPWAVSLMLMQWAADTGVRRDGVNPLHGAKAPEKTVPAPRAITDEEWERLRAKAVSAARRHHRATWDLVHLLIVLRYTGVRINEALALQWSDVNLDAEVPVAKVTKTLLDARQGMPRSIGPTKTGDARTIALHEDVVDALEARRPENPAPDEFVFATGRRGEPMQASNARLRLRALVKDTDLAWIHPHSFRHTLATKAKRSDQATGEEAAAALLGHKDASVTRRHYIERDGVVVLDPRFAFDPAPEAPDQAQGA